MESLWRKQEETIVQKEGDKQTASKTENRHFDVIVVGAGLAGLLTAYYLKELGKNVLVLEADRIASGQTERTTAKITSQHGLKYSKLLKDAGEKKARLYARANEAAIWEYEKLIKGQRIACEFEKAPAYLYTMEDETVLKKEAEAAEHLGIDAFFTRETELPFEVKGAVCFRNQARFSPLAFIRHIAAQLNILEHTKVTEIKGNRVITDETEMTADKIVIATHYPLRNVPGFYFLRQHQERSCVLALSGCEKMKGMYYGIDENGLSFRQAGDFLLLGGGSYRTGENECGGNYEALGKAAEQYFPQSQEVCRWSAQDCMPHDGIPFIGKYSIFTPDLYVVTGFQKWGMTSAMVAAMVLKDELCGIQNPYAKLFSPQRMNVRAGIGNLLHDINISIKGLSKGWFYRSRRKEVPFQCSHLGCSLTWNEEEGSFDCPCHGSRFDKNGKLLDNPAKTDAWK